MLRLRLAPSIALVVLAWVSGSGQGATFRRPSPSLGAPPLFGAVRSDGHRRSAVSAALEVRGGGVGGKAGPKAAAKASVAESGAASDGDWIQSSTKWLTDLFSPSKIGWTISLGISLLYLYFYNKMVNNGGMNCNYSEGGFCVTNIDPALDADPKCPTINNSHTWAFAVDCIFTVLAMVWPAPPDVGTLLRWFTAFGIIGVHGGLHALLGIFFKCGNLGELGETVYGIFGAGISFGILQISSSLDFIYNLAIGIAAGFLMFFLAGENGENGISGIFMLTHIIASLAGSFVPNDGMKDPAKGLSLIPSTLTSSILWQGRGKVSSSFSSSVVNFMS